MRRIPLVALAITLGLATLLPAQTMVEYSSISTHSAGALGARHTRGHKTGDHYGTTKGQVWQEKDARLKDANPSPPAPPAVFVLNSGERLEAAEYVLTPDTLRVTQHDQERSIPMAELNRTATLAANQQRGLALKLPDSKGQMMLSF